MVNVLDLAARGIGEGGDRIVSASRSSGSKLPRHRFFSCHRIFPYHRFFLWLWGTASRPSGDKSSHHKRGWGIG